MHHTVKSIFRLCFAIVIFLITAALLLTSYSKSMELIHAEKQFSHAETRLLQSSENNQLLLISSNQRPDYSIFITVTGNGFIEKLSCKHYLSSICTDKDNQKYHRQIQQLTLLHVGQQRYIQQVTYIDSNTAMQHQLNFSDEELKQFYQADMQDLKYKLIAIILFTAAALYVSGRILRNFRKFCAN